MDSRGKNHVINQLKKNFQQYPTSLHDKSPKDTWNKRNIS